MDDWKEYIEWDDLITEILQEQCILIVGPDLVNFQSADSFFQLLIQQLKQVERLRRDIELTTSFIFEHDELFQLQPNGRDTSLYIFLRKFYQDRQEFAIPFSQIARIPFHLIISLLPDKRLCEIYQQLGFNFNFGYFPRTPGSSVSDVVTKPSKGTPLIYNLMGVLDPPDAVLTFDDYFQYLQNILPENALPPLLNIALHNAKSFLFLGVHFDKWNIQLLFRKLIPYNTRENRRLKYSILKGLQDSDTFTFLAHRLELDFHEIEPNAFLNELYKRMEEKGYLKQPRRIFKKRVFLSYSHSNSETVIKLRNQLDKADIEVVMDESNMPFGEQIRHFMTIVNNVDKVIVILSETSLQSPWVSKEVSLTLENQKSLIPCFIDKYFLDEHYVPATIKNIDSKLRQIDQLIVERNAINPLDPLLDLRQERELWREFGVRLPEQAAFFQGSKAMPVDDQNFDNSLQLLINSILN
jgi:hypothetical protein